MKKFLSFSLLATLVFGIFTFLPTESAEAAERTYTSNFKTNDGAWDGTIKVTKPNNALLHVVTINSNRNVDFTRMKLRLCSASTGNCTPYKNLESNGHWMGNITSFSNMVPGTYRIDIVDPWSFSVSGSVYTMVNEG